MKPRIKKRIVFVSKSMLWSLLLYIVLMLAFNWDDVSNALKTQPATGIVTSAINEQKDANISTRNHTTKAVFVIFRMLSGVSGKASSY